MRSELMRWEWEGGAVPSDEDAADTKATRDESKDEDHVAYAERDPRQCVGLVQR